MSKMHVEVVSTEELIYSGEAEFLVARRWKVRSVSIRDTCRS
jgi:hypothetical protein